MYTLNNLRRFNSGLIKDKQAVTTYEQYFVDFIHARLAVLSSEVVGMGFQADELVNADVLECVINTLIGDFDATRQRTEAEIAAILREAPDWFGRAMLGNELSPRAVSVGIDIGMYFGNRLLEANAALAWKMVVKPKSQMEYGKVCVAGFPRNVVFEPVNIGTNVVRRSVSGRLGEWVSVFVASWKASCDF